MILKVAFAVMTVLAVIAGVVALTGEPALAAGFSFGTAVLSAVGLAYLMGRDGKNKV